MTTDSKGLLWKRIDLHFHSPGSSDDYKDKSITPEQLVASAKHAGLDGFAVTDHNTGAWIDKIKRAATKAGIVVFPGVEVSVMGGERNVHILAIFDPSKGTAAVHDFLAQVHITQEKRGSVESLARGDVSEVIDKIAQLGGVPLLAHCDSTSGVTDEIRGQARIQIVQNPNLLGAEITKASTAAFFRGDDPNYKRKLAVFQGSDCHSPQDIGRRASYFKLGAMTIAALRQCFYDPDIRIRFANNSPVRYPILLGMEVTGGFFDGVSFKLHPGLNAVIGGKGVGKSLLIEFLRFSLDQPSHVGAIKTDHESKLVRQLGVGGIVKVECQMSSGSTYFISRSFDQISNPIEVMDISRSLPYSGRVSSLFPVLAYSQNEVIDISRDSSVQLSLIDRMIDLEGPSRDIEECVSKLESIVVKYIEARSASERVHDFDMDIATKKIKIKELDFTLSNAHFQEQQYWERRAGQLQEASKLATGFAEVARGVVQNGRAFQLPSLSDEDQKDVELRSYFRELSQVIARIQSDFEGCLVEFENTLVTASMYRRRWQYKREIWDRKFQEFLQEAGGEQAALATQRTKLAGELGELEEKRQAFVELATKFQEYKEEYGKLLDQLDCAKERLYQTRSKVYVELTNRSSGRLKLELKAGADRSSFNGALEDLFRGMNIQKRYREQLVQAMAPRSFVEAVLNENQAMLEEKGGLTNNASTKVLAGIPSNEHLMRKMLLIPFRSMSEDVPEILYQKEDGNYYPLEELSVGQKCTALMLIALSEGESPIIIDQPEDALDVATVYKDVVQRLRSEKDSRQFIITTHNSNVAVSSDADKYHVLKGTATAGEVACAGAIDSENVAGEVIEHLEGGVEPYKLRGHKYNI